ncbi:MAG: hypothetical protein WC551_05375 [Patescibacteria group bacterium]
MFDSVPPNLPVEPTPGAPLMPPVVPPAPNAPAPMPQVVGQARKEPEDIFKGLEMGGETLDKSIMPDIVEAGPKRNWLMIAGIILAGLVVLGGIGFGIWYFIQVKNTAVPVATAPETDTPTQPTQQVEQPPIVPEQPVTTPPAGTNVPTPEVPAQPEAQPPETAATPTAPVVAAAPTEGVDMDADMLADAEEALFGTNPAAKDTNSNGYDDGAEVRNLYDPLVKGSLLEKSPKVAWGGFESFRFLVPAGWKVTLDSIAPQNALVDSGTPTKFRLMVRPNPGRQSLAAWLGTPAGDTNMQPLKLKSGIEAYQSADGLTTYLGIDGTILNVNYELDGAASYDYRTVYAMLINSFQKAPVK